MIKSQVEQCYANRRLMKLKTPFLIIKNAFGDIQLMHDFNNEIPTETRKEFWGNERDRHPANSTCKTYEV